MSSSSALNRPAYSASGRPSLPTGEGVTGAAQIDILTRRAALDPNPTTKAELLNALAPLLHGAAARALKRFGNHNLRSAITIEDLIQQGRYYVIHLLQTFNPTLGQALPYFSFRVNAKLQQYVARETRNPGISDRQPVLLSMFPDHTQLQLVAPPDEIDLGWDASLELALNSLRPSQRLIVQLAYVYDLSDGVIAQLTNRGVGAVRQQRYRVLHALHKKLASH